MQESLEGSTFFNFNSRIKSEIPARSIFFGV